jgi:hypothetical protein
LESEDELGMALEAGFGHHAVGGDGVQIPDEFGQDAVFEDGGGAGVPEDAGDDFDDVFAANEAAVCIRSSRGSWTRSPASTTSFT